MQDSSSYPLNDDWEQFVLDISKSDCDFDSIVPAASSAPAPSQPMSPPLSSEVSAWSDNTSSESSHSSNSSQEFTTSKPSAKTANVDDIFNDDPFTWDYPSSQHVHVDLSTPAQSPTLDDCISWSPNANNNDGIVDSALMPESRLHNQGMPSWLTTPELGVAKTRPAQRSTSYFPAAEAVPVWWNDASSAPLIQPHPTSFHRHARCATTSVAMHLHAKSEAPPPMPLPHREASPKLITKNDPTLSPPARIPTGLGIQMPTTMNPIPQSCIIPPPSPPPMPKYSSASYHRLRSPSRHHTRTRTDGSNSINHHKVRRGDNHNYNHQPPSTTSSGSPSPKTPSSSQFQLQKRRTHSRKMSEMSPRTPKTPSSGAGAIDFVNFTPHDSRKILTGVAPSGSSKTKARREKEAREKSRKLSQAAFRAIRAAGGDPRTALDFEGLMFQ